MQFGYCSGMSTPTLTHVLYKHQTGLYVNGVSFCRHRDRFKMLHTVLVSNMSDLEVMVRSEARIILLYSTREEARSILKAAEQMGLTGEKYVWIATQSVIGSAAEVPAEFPVGMLGNILTVSSKYIKLHKSVNTLDQVDRIG